MASVEDNISGDFNNKNASGRLNDAVNTVISAHSLSPSLDQGNKNNNNGNGAFGDTNASTMNNTKRSNKKIPLKKKSDYVEKDDGVVIIGKGTSGLNAKNARVIHTEKMVPIDLKSSRNGKNNRNNNNNSNINNNTIGSNNTTFNASMTSSRGGVNASSKAQRHTHNNSSNNVMSMNQKYNYNNPAFKSYDELKNEEACHYYYSPTLYTQRLPEEKEQHWSNRESNFQNWKEVHLKRASYVTLTKDYASARNINMGGDGNPYNGYSNSTGALDAYSKQHADEVFELERARAKEMRKRREKRRKAADQKRQEAENFVLQQRRRKLRGEAVDLPDAYYLRYLHDKNLKTVQNNNNNIDIYDNNTKIAIDTDKITTREVFNASVGHKNYMKIKKMEEIDAKMEANAKATEALRSQVLAIRQEERDFVATMTDKNNKDSNNDEGGATNGDETLDSRFPSLRYGVANNHNNSSNKANTSPLNNTLASTLSKNSTRYDCEETLQKGRLNKAEHDEFNHLLKLQREREREEKRWHNHVLLMKIKGEKYDRNRDPYFNPDGEANYDDISSIFNTTNDDGFKNSNSNSNNNNNDSVKRGEDTRSSFTESPSLPNVNANANRIFYDEISKWNNGSNNNNNNNSKNKTPTPPITNAASSQFAQANGQSSLQNNNETTNNSNNNNNNANPNSASRSINNKRFQRNDNDPNNSNTQSKPKTEDYLASTFSHSALTQEERQRNYEEKSDRREFLDTMSRERLAQNQSLFSERQEYLRNLHDLQLTHYANYSGASPSARLQESVAVAHEEELKAKEENAARREQNKEEEYQLHCASVQSIRKEEGVVHAQRVKERQEARAVAAKALRLEEQYIHSRVREIEESEATERKNKVENARIPNAPYDLSTAYPYYY